jgi:predicted nucleotidyltransferase component of viral defense system
MKEYIKNILNKYSDRDVIYRRNILKEYLQENILYIIYRSGLLNELIFEGGTALRFLFDLKRFSEDLDFSLSGESFKVVNFSKRVKYELESMNYEVEVKNSGSGSVKRSSFRFPGLLHSYELSKEKSQKVSVLVEIDSNPPEGGQTEVSIISRQYIFRVRHYSLPSLMAKKISAIIARNFNKGRDFYDFLWYLSRNIKPDFELLNNAIRQIKRDFPKLKEKNWKSELMVLLEDVDFKRIRNDVSNFLENREESEMLEFQTFQDILGG